MRLQDLGGPRYCVLSRRHFVLRQHRKSLAHRLHRRATTKWWSFSRPLRIQRANGPRWKRGKGTQMANLPQHREKKNSRLNRNRDGCPVRNREWPDM